MRACFEFVARQKQLFIFFGENVNLLCRARRGSRGNQSPVGCSGRHALGRAFPLPPRATGRAGAIPHLPRHPPAALPEAPQLRRHDGSGELSELHPHRGSTLKQYPPKS